MIQWDQAWPIRGEILPLVCLSDSKNTSWKGREKYGISAEENKHKPEETTPRFQAFFPLSIFKMKLTNNILIKLQPIQCIVVQFHIFIKRLGSKSDCFKQRTNKKNLLKIPKRHGWRLTFSLYNEYTSLKWNNESKINLNGIKNNRIKKLTQNIHKILSKCAKFQCK